MASIDMYRSLMTNIMLSTSLEMCPLRIIFTLNPFHLLTQIQKAGKEGNLSVHLYGL